jgi:hypothetical protein
MYQLTGTLRCPEDPEGGGLSPGKVHAVASDDGHSLPSLSSGRRMSDTMISYRHDTGAWLNAEQGLPCAPGHVCRRWPAERDERQDAFVALEDLWI